MEPQNAHPAAFSRERLLVGDDGMDRLRSARVLVCGVGGVGSAAVEALARAAVGHFRLVDFDTVNPSNINRQLHALHSTLGRAKVEVVASRIRDINPDAEVVAERRKVTVETVATYLEPVPDHVVDAIDDTDAKIALLAECAHRKIPVVSAMGAANKLLPGEIRITDIEHSRKCPLARVVRKRLRRLGICGRIAAVYSEELPIRLADGAFQAEVAEEAGDKRPQGTISYMPSLFGLHCASVVIRNLLGDLSFSRRGEAEHTL
ncbi:MAG: ThiF family adenylyltransferase [Lentisphaeria bacterium]|nr:ThiF family adenylyltransferase [Lentisphaeria bacterium]